MALGGRRLFATACAGGRPGGSSLPGLAALGAVVLIGLGVLILPDFSLHARLRGGLAGVVGPGLAGLLRPVGAGGAALPVGYELFRNGSDASLAPNTARPRRGRVAGDREGPTSSTRRVPTPCDSAGRRRRRGGRVRGGAAGPRETLQGWPRGGCPLSTVWVVRVAATTCTSFPGAAVFAAFFSLSVVDVAWRSRRPAELAIPAVVVVGAVVSLLVVPTRGQVPGPTIRPGPLDVNERPLYEGWNGTSRADLEQYYRRAVSPTSSTSPWPPRRRTGRVLPDQRIPLRTGAVPAGQGVRGTLRRRRQADAYGPGIVLFDRFGLD